jgi:hypothetical protein
VLLLLLLLLLPAAAPPPRCSAGISVNKLLAKLVSGLHKPNQQTVLAPEQAAVSSSRTAATGSSDCH